MDRYELHRSGGRLHLEPRAFEVLGYLVAHRGRVVSKDELIERLWKNRAVSDSALTRVIRDTRRVLGDTGSKERWIQTVHGRGFRFEGEVTEVGPRSLPAGLLPQRKTTENFLAYQLYLQGRYCFFRYTAEEVRKAIDYFDQAVGADPDFALAHAGIAVAYAELAIEGFVDVTSEVAHQRALSAVSEALRLDPRLGEAYGLRGLLRFTHDFDWRGAEQDFLRGLELSPACADIYCHYGWLCQALERLDDAITLTRRARELDPRSHPTDLGTSYLRADRPDLALEVAEQALLFDPSITRAHALKGWALLLGDRPDEGLACLEHAVALSEGGTLFLGQLGQAYAMTGRRDDARSVLAQLEALRATRYVSPYHLAYVHTGLGEHDEAIGWLEQALHDRVPNLFGIRGSFLFRSLRTHPRFVALLGKMNLA